MVIITVIVEGLLYSGTMWYIYLCLVNTLLLHIMYTNLKIDFKEISNLTKVI